MTFFFKLGKETLLRTERISLNIFRDVPCRNFGMMLWDVIYSFLKMSLIFLLAVSEYFNASCVPGANSANYPASLCQLCKGDLSGQKKCQGNSQEQYYDYSGAFR